MATKIKGIYKGFKNISQIFVVKEREIEIGYPTEVKHVSHIGWSDQSGSAPSWLSEFNTGPEFASTSIGNYGSALSPWSSLDLSESMRLQLPSDMLKDEPSVDHPNIPRKPRRKKKAKSTSSPKSKSVRPVRSKAKMVEETTKPSNTLEVA